MSEVPLYTHNPKATSLRAEALSQEGGSLPRRQDALVFSCRRRAHPPPRAGPPVAGEAQQVTSPHGTGRGRKRVLGVRFGVWGVGFEEPPVRTPVVRQPS